jgi:hypothetical protein
MSISMTEEFYSSCGLAYRDSVLKVGVLDGSVHGESKQRRIRSTNKTQEHNKLHKSTKIKLVWPFTANGRRKNGKKVYKWKPMLRRPLG